MPIISECPTSDRLQKLALGLLGDPEIDSLSSHVLECSRCAETIADLNARDTLADALRACPQAADAMPRDAAVERAIEQACRLKPAKPDPGSIADTGATGGLSTRDSGKDELPGKPAAAPNLDDVLSPPQTPDELGRLGPYRVLKLLDSGGMGMVFLAEDVQLQRQVALKAMRPSLATSAEARQRFLREARAAAALRHDNIVTIYHVGEDRGALWLAMELLEGEPLESWLKRETRLPAAEAVRIGRQIAEALVAAHSRGLIHRDIKPANVWLQAPTGRVKVLDFGLARVESDDAQLTQSGMVVGTPAYMAPEQARGDAVDPRCDLFSLGCVLYRALTGRNPFRGKDTMATLMALATHTPPPVRELAADVPAELDELVAKLLTKDPQDRPQTAAEVAKSLVAIETRMGAIARLPSSDGGACVDKPLVAPTEALSLALPVSPARRRPPRRVAAIALATAAAALVIALAVFLTVRTPYGEVIVELGPGVKPDDVQIEVKGNSEVKLADAKHGWTIDVREGRYNVQLAANTDRFDIDRNTVTVSRNKKTHLKVTVKSVVAAQPPATPKPLFENDFSSSAWLEAKNPTAEYRKIFSIHGGRLIIQAQPDAVPRPPPWWSADIDRWVKSADIEIVGRATSGSWGFDVKNNQEPAFGMVINVDSKGQLAAWRTAQASGDKGAKGSKVDIHTKPTNWREGNNFNVLRAIVQDSQIRVWVNGDEACEPIEISDPMPLMMFRLSGQNSEPSLYCEFDSVRLWRAGEGPPLLPLPAVPTEGNRQAALIPPAAPEASREPAKPKPFYENDFTVPDPTWIDKDNLKEFFAFREGRFVIHSPSPTSRFWSGTIPLIGAADIEIVGRSSSGSWGFVVFNSEWPALGMMVALNTKGTLEAWRTVKPSQGARTQISPIAVQPKPVKWKGGEAFNVMRAVVRDGQVTVTVNGDPACDPITLPDPLPVLEIKLVGQSISDAAGLHCEFDSIRVWRAGEGPPLPVETAMSKPFYESDFSGADSAWLPDIERRQHMFLRDGRFVIQSSTGTPWFWNRGNIPWTETADIEIVGRATSGSWGFCLWNDQQPSSGVRVALNSKGELEARRLVESGSAQRPDKILLPSQQVSSWKGNGAFNVLRAIVRDGLVTVWLNRESACNPIKLDDPFPSVSIALSGQSQSVLSCEFDSIRIWRAGEGPPLPRTTATPKLFYENDFSTPDSKWVPPEKQRPYMFQRDGRFVIQHSKKDEWWWHGNVPWIDTPDIEIVGRATQGLWGLYMMSAAQHTFGIIVALDSNGKLAAWRAVQASPSNLNCTPIDIRSKPVTWHEGDAFNVLRTVVRDGQVMVFVNGQEACDAIPMPDPIPLMTIALAGRGSESGPHSEFESIRVWRAGEGPPLPVVSVPRTAGSAPVEPVAIEK